MRAGRAGIVGLSFTREPPVGRVLLDALIVSM